MQRIIRIGTAAIVAAVCLTTLPGCGYPSTAPANQELITSLRTALSARNESWLKGNIELVEKRHASGAMNDEEYEAFKHIFDMAQGGDWEGAEQASLEFQKAQRPTPEQIEAVEKRTR